MINYVMDTKTKVVFGFYKIVISNMFFVRDLLTKYSLEIYLRWARKLGSQSLKKQAHFEMTNINIFIYLNQFELSRELISVTSVGRMFSYDNYRLSFLMLLSRKIPFLLWKQSKRFPKIRQGQYMKFEKVRTHRSRSEEEKKDRSRFLYS